MTNHPTAVERWQKCHPHDGSKVITIHLLGTMNICKRPAPDISAWTKVLDRYPQSLAAASLKSDAAFSSSNIKIIAERHIVSPCKPDLTYCSWMDNWCQENFILHFKHTKNLPLHANPPPSFLFLFKADRTAFEFDCSAQTPSLSSAHKWWPPLQSLI